MQSKDVMTAAWRLSHGDLPEDEVPAVNWSFENGFEAAWDLLFPLLQQAAPHVYGSHGAAHMLDGFRPRPRPIDKLVEQIKAVLSEHD